MASPFSPTRATVFAAAFLVAIPAYALATESVGSLAQLERGRWQVRNLDSDSDIKAVCIGDPMQLAQLEHSGALCRTEVIESGPTSSTVRYTCEGRGFGQSTIKVETPRSTSVTTQGLKEGRPFSFRAAARKVGDC